MSPITQETAVAHGPFFHARCWVRLFVGNLPYAMTEAELKQQLARFGAVLDVYILRTPQGDSRGMLSQQWIAATPQPRSIAVFLAICYGGSTSTSLARAITEPPSEPLASPIGKLDSAGVVSL